MGQGVSGQSACDTEKGRIERAGLFDVGGRTARQTDHDQPEHLPLPVQIGLPVIAAAPFSPGQTAKESRQKRAEVG